MKYYNLDMVVMGHLLNKGYPMHWYVDFLKYGINAILDLNLYHKVPIVNTKEIVIRPDGSGDLPCDFVDHIRVGMPFGNYIRPMVQNANFNNLATFDSQANRIAPENIEETPRLMYGDVWHESYINAYGEILGRMFNFDRNNDTYKIIRERGEIQLHSSMKDVGMIVMDYISDGIDCDAATRVDPYVKNYLEYYMDWQMKEHARQYSRGDCAAARELVNSELRKVRASNNDLTIEDVKRIVRRSFTGTYKS